MIIEEREAEPFSLAAVEEHQSNRKTQATQILSCFRCGNPETETVLIPCRNEGESLWVCVKCLPPLIHGAH
jgi:hypothetical protein